MSAPERQSFAETAMRLGGKSDEEASRLGAVDRADEQVEALFAPQYQTVNSPVHQAVWDGKAPLTMFMPPPLSPASPCSAAMDRCLEIVTRRRQAGTLFDQAGKVAPASLNELAEAGYWGLLIDRQYGGKGASFAQFIHFLTRVAVQDGMVAGLASVHGCIRRGDPLRSFGKRGAKAAATAEIGQRRGVVRLRADRTGSRLRPHRSANHGHIGGRQL